MDLEKCQGECPVDHVRHSGGADHLECEPVFDGDYSAACSVFGEGSEYDSDLERCACMEGYSWRTRDWVKEF